MANRGDLELGRVTGNRNFLLLWAAQVISQLAFNILNFVLIVRVFQTSGSSIAVSLLILSIGVPALVFGLLAGVYVDRWNRKWVLVTTNLLRALVVPLYLLLPTSLAWIYIVTFVIASITQFFAPAETATIPALVRGRALQTANTLFLFTLYGAFIVGYSIAGPIQHLIGERAPFFLATGAYLLAALLTFLLPSFAPSRPHALRRVTDRLSHGGQKPGLLRELREGIREIRADPRLSRPILFLTLAQTIIGVVIVLMPAFSEQILGISVQNASYILIAPAGAGMIVGAILMARRHGRSRLQLISLGVLVAGLALIGTSLGRGVGRLLRAEAAEPHSHLVTQGFLSLTKIISLLSIVGTMIFILGLATSLVMISAQTLLQESTNERIRGRVFGTLNMLVNVAATLPLLLAGVLADLTSVLWVFFMLGLLVSIWGIFEVFRSRQAVTT